MEPIRVHLGQMPHLLRTFINDLLEGETDISVVGHSFESEESLAAARQEQADLLISQDQSWLRDRCTAWIFNGAPPAIFAVGEDGLEGTGVVRRTISLNEDGCTLADAVRQLLRTPACPEFDDQRRDRCQLP